MFIYISILIFLVQIYNNDDQHHLRRKTTPPTSQPTRRWFPTTVPHHTIKGRGQDSRRDSSRAPGKFLIKKVFISYFTNDYIGYTTTNLAREEKRVRRATITITGPNDASDASFGPLVSATTPPAPARPGRDKWLETGVSRALTGSSFYVFYFILLY